MCHITYVPYKKMPESIFLYKFLKETFKRNDDGAGVSFFNKEGRGYHAKHLKSMSAIIEAVSKQESSNGFLFHARLVSRGKGNSKNIHPFYVNNKSTFFCHNGTVRYMKKLKHVSDTKLVASMLENNDRDIHEILMYILKREKYRGNTFILQSNDEINVYNYRRFASGYTKDGIKVFTSSGLGMLDKCNTISYGIHKLYPTEQIRYGKKEIYNSAVKSCKGDPYKIRRCNNCEKWNDVIESKYFEGKHREKFICTKCLSPVSDLYSYSYNDRNTANEYGIDIYRNTGRNKNVQSQFAM